MKTIAHRGAAAVAPENTLAAFREAIKAGADMIELDVRLSQDGEVMVFHDRDLSRTTDGIGLMEERNREELGWLDAGSWFSANFKGEGIPTLQEVIWLISPGRMELCIEIKIDQERIDLREKLVINTLNVIEKNGFQDRALIASFDRESIIISKKNNPEIRTGLIFSKKEVWAEFKDHKCDGIDVLSAWWKTISADQVKKIHQSDREVIAWTIDTEEELGQVLPLSVDAIASNNPAWLIKSIGDYNT